MEVQWTPKLYLKSNKFHPYFLIIMGRMPWFIKSISGPLKAGLAFGKTFFFVMLYFLTLFHFFY